MIKVFIKPYNITVKGREGELLSEIIKRAIPEFPLPCGGRGFCGKCKVKILHGRLSPLTGNELLHGCNNSLRLACQARVLSDLVIEIPKIGEFKAITSGIEPKLTSFTPLITTKIIKIGRPTLDNPIPYDRNIIFKANASSIKYKAIRKIPFLVKSECSLKVLLRNDVIVDIIRNNEKVLGLAVDVGTTKIAAYLIDLESGVNLAEDYVLNPQGKYGDDVISRITHAMRDTRTLEDMHRLTINAIEELARRLCVKVKLPVSNIHAMCIVGNTVMINILANIDPAIIGRSPFTPYFSSTIEGYGSELGFSLLGDVWFFIPPAITGFVGADAIADIITVEALGIEKPSLLLDIGTNTEVALFTERELIVTSAPAGPALEGGNISCGIKSLEGAIYKVELDRESKKVKRYWVYGKTPLGLSGSGVLSLVAELLRCNVLSKNGKLKGTVFEIIPNKIVITQKDIREVQKAKAAISSAWRMLMKLGKVSIKELKNVYICGSFGSSIEPRDALDLGLIPSVSINRVITLGNAAGMGAKIMLKSEEYRKRAEEIVKEAKFVELASHPEFMKIWLSSLNFC